jgi:hypothetical protein
MKKLHLIYALAIASMLFVSCEKVVDLDLNDNNATLVIEGNITNDIAPFYVTLSKTVPFGQNSIYPAVTNAVVVINDNSGNKDTLTHIGNGKYKTNTTIGVPGRTYSLTVDTDGKIYTANSTMPELVNLDSLRNTSFTFGNTANKVVIPIYQDPIREGNNYRFIYSINGKIDQTYIQWNDNVNNGDVNQRPIFSNDPDVETKTGDVVSIEMQCIDRVVYTYYFTLAQIAGNGPGGGTTPTNAPNNITGGALGLFSAHCTQTKSIVIP